VTKHVVVVGAGVIGLSVALFCARRGLRVTLLERNRPERDGCSFQNTGMVVPSHFVPLAAPGVVSLALRWMWNPASPFYLKPRLSWDLIDWALKFCRAATHAHVRRAAPLLRDLSFASRASFVELGEDDDFGFAARGTLILCRTRHALDEEAAVAKRANALGIRADVLDARQAALAEPGTRMDVAGAVYFPDDCNLDPGRLISTLERRGRDAGVHTVWDAEVVDWRNGAGRVRAAALADGRKIEGDEFVLACGCWSQRLADRLGLKLPLQAGKGYSLTLASPARKPKRCAILSEARVAVSPMADRLRFGGTMELAGIDESVNPIRVRGIVEAISRYYPDFRPDDFQGVEPWRGLRPCAPDGLPYVGRTRRAANVTVATGHAMMGVSLAPVTGKLVSEIVCGERPSFEIGLLSPDRYH
jgi:D-amino-acid dehydrogenase